MLILAAALPIAIVVLVSVVVNTTQLVASAPDPPHKAEAREIIAGLSAELTQIALLVIGACAILLRDQRDKMSTRLVAVAVLVLSTAIACCYVGFRYRLVVAQQVAYGNFNFNTTGERLVLQTWLLLFALSALIVLALQIYVPATKPPPPAAKPAKPAAAPKPARKPKGR